MARLYFLFNGGNVKKVDDGRNRVPLTPQEAEVIFYDTELPGDTDNSIGGRFDFNQMSCYLQDLAVGDEIMIGVAPDAALYRGFWFGAQDKAEGLEVIYDLVSIADVHEAYLAGNAAGVAAKNPTGVMSYDFADGLGEGSCDANIDAALYGDAYTDFRNNAALKFEPFAAPLFLGLGQAVYFRITIVALPDAPDENDPNCCNSCDSKNDPMFQFGAIYDRTCFDKQISRKQPCNCDDPVCDC